MYDNKCFIIQSTMLKIKSYFQEKVENASTLFKFLGPGFVVTVGFIDPGNWATNISAGSDFGYKLLWVVTASTILLILLQYNASKLGIVSGKCIAEATANHYKKPVAKFILYSAMLAVVSTVVAEILGGAIALQMIFDLPIKIGVVVISAVALFLIFSNTYNKIENIIMGFVAIIAISFLLELVIANVDWVSVAVSTVAPRIDNSSIYITMGIIGAVVMPHNLFLHSEFIQSRTQSVEGDTKTFLKLAKYDTIISMIVGWAINSAMIILAASTFYVNNHSVSELGETATLLIPLLGKTAFGIFALALLFSGIASSITAGMSGGVINAGINHEEYNIHDRHTSLGVIIPIILSIIIVLFISDPFQGLILSQVILSIQLPITIVALITLTSSKSIMGKDANSFRDKIILWFCAGLVIILNIVLLISFFMN